ncbi:hypothetical protein BB559_003440 [Furculomyces boomerangus]|uniref:RecQ-mediated genome instability protein 1 n=1 Tax=Furculomyces boomerangus TaxID=61424 RepID=A0A2T9YLD9_9FUNG|nr:hypothetical protein BB559_003440 [Furculomyces boomerangus]
MTELERIKRVIYEKNNLELKNEWLKLCIQEIKNRGRSTDNELEEKVWNQVLNVQLSACSNPSIKFENDENGVSKPIIPKEGVLLEVVDVMDVGVSNYRLWEEIKSRIEEKKRIEQISLIQNMEARSRLMDAHQLRLNNLENSDDFDEIEEEEIENAFNKTGGNKNKDYQSNDYTEKLSKVNGLSRGMLKLLLTDGSTVLSAIELNRVSHIDVELPLGTKVFLKRLNLLPPQNILVLDNNLVVIGGKPACYSKLTLYNRLCVLLGKPVDLEPENTSENINITRDNNSTDMIGQEIVDISDIDMDFSDIEY